MPVRHKSLRFGLLGAVVAASVAIAAFLVLRPEPAVDRMIAREEAALESVREAAAAEKEFAARKTKDWNRDGAAEYGDLVELKSAGLLPRLLSSDAEGAFLDVGGYRVEVLLPSGRDRAGRTALSRSPTDALPELAALHFAVVALPRRGVPSGLRGFYLDEKGRLYEAEGVCDAAGDPHQPPPSRLLLEADEDLGNEGPVWRLRGAPKGK